MAYNTWKFVTDRIPNVQEMLPEILIRSFISTRQINKLEDFYNNFIASSILKDISKLPFTFYNIWNKQEVGGTGYIYDEGAIYAKTLKVLCKSTILIPTQIFFPKKLIKGGYMSNFTCEPIDNFFIIASKARQDSIKEQESNRISESIVFTSNDNKQESYYEYTSNYYKSSWFIDSIIAASVKTISKMYIESHLKTLTIDQHFTDLSNKITDFININESTAFYNVILFAGENIGKIIHAYSLVVPVWIAQDLPEEITKYYYNYNDTSENHEELNYLDLEGFIDIWVLWMI